MTRSLGNIDFFTNHKRVGGKNRNVCPHDFLLAGTQDQVSITICLFIPERQHKVQMKEKRQQFDFPEFEG
jgi:hypothetical protein